MPKLYKPSFLSFLLLITLIFPLVARADFDYNNIISDAEANNYNSLSQVDIKNFLVAHNSFLANYFYEGNNPGPTELAIAPEGEYFKERSATEIIWNAAQQAKINPMFILTTLQKEMGLIEDSNPTENELAYAMGYGCPDNGGCDFRFKGFGKQVKSASLQFRYYIDNIEEYKHRPGRRSCVDDYNPYVPCTDKGTEVKPANRITAAMYVYTPHISGNKLFRVLWEKYGFASSTSGAMEQPGILPDGALVKAKDGDDTKSIYLIHNNSKLPFATMTALVSRYDPQKVLAVSSVELAKYDTGQPIKFSNYSIVQSPDGDRYLIDGLNKRLISSNTVFKKLGFNPAEVIDATFEDLAAMADGEIIASADVSPFGKLMKDMTTGIYYYVKDGLRAQIIDPIIIKANYSGLKTAVASSKTLAKYADTAPAKLVDGTIIKKDKDPNVYVISGSLRRLIPDAQTFEALGYSWKSILVVSSKVLNFHVLGQNIGQ